LYEKLKEISYEIKNNTAQLHQTKIQNLRAKFDSIQKGEDKEWSNILGSEPLRLPLDPSILVTGIKPSDATIFNSATKPMRLSFVTADNKLYRAIFKSGDDLRQDQLVMQIINLMNDILKGDNLDLKLTPYRVLACGPQEGFLECVTPSIAFDEIIKKGMSIEKWLKEQNSNKSNHEINEIFDNFMKSCAGYCVITYILGVGDRPTLG